MIEDQPLAALIRRIDPQNFSSSAHGQGHRLAVSEKGEATHHQPGLLARLLSPAASAQYFVYQLATPLKVEGWTFNWSEGTSAISLDFDATFEIQANHPDHARRLAESLHDAAGPTLALRRLVQSHLHEVMTQQMVSCQQQSLNLLSLFRTSSVGIGESESVNNEVGRRVRDALGGLHFRIGLRLRNLPPMQVEVRHRDAFILADSKQSRTVETTALLELSNFQTLQKAGLRNEEDIQQEMRNSIQHAVKHHLFAQRYFDVVRSFSEGLPSSIEQQMRSRIAEDAARLGYQVRMFQTFPDIAALKLLGERRIELAAEDNSYRLKNMAGQVRLGVALSVKACDFALLGRLIEPDEADVMAPIQRQVRQICQEQLQRITLMSFNLQFDEVVKPNLMRALKEGLGGLGLSALGIDIPQMPTDEAARFGALCGQVIPFTARISAQANHGDADDVVMTARFEITGMPAEPMAVNAWECFVRKDFGYRQDSQWSEVKLKHQASELGLKFDEAVPMSEQTRRQLAIDVELDAIRQSVVSAIENGLSTEDQLAVATRTQQGREHLMSRAALLARDAILKEFGLTVEVQSVKREDTATEVSFAIRRQVQHDIIRDGARQSRELEANKARVHAAGVVEGIQEDYAIRKELLLEKGTDPMDDLLRVDQRLAQSQRGASEGSQLTEAGAIDMLRKSVGQAPRLDAPSTPSGESTPTATR